MPALLNMEQFKEIASDKHFFVGFDSKNHILLMKFIGAMKDDEYKQIWQLAFDQCFEKGIEKLLIDQTEIGNVSFSARAWVMVKLYPKIKRELSPDMVAGIISSTNVVHRTGLQYLVKAFQKMSGYKIDFHENYEEATTWLNRINAPIRAKV